MWMNEKEVSLPRLRGGNAEVVDVGPGAAGIGDQFDGVGPACSDTWGCRSAQFVQAPVLMKFTGSDAAAIDVEVQGRGWLPLA